MSLLVKVVQPSGILDGTQINSFDRLLGDVMQEKPDIVLIDLQNVTFMDSSGLRLLVSAFKNVKAANMEFFICSVNQQVKMLCELTGVNKLFPILPDRHSFNQVLHSLKAS